MIMQVSVHLKKNYSNLIEACPSVVPDVLSWAFRL